jgi:hypothetical protein
MNFSNIYKAKVSEFDQVPLLQTLLDRLSSFKTNYSAVAYYLLIILQN